MIGDGLITYINFRIRGNQQLHLLETQTPLMFKILQRLPENDHTR